MNDPLIDGRTYGLRFAKPARVERDFAAFQPTQHWVAVEEDLTRTAGMGLVLPDRKNTVFGRVLKAGPDAEADGVSAGDRIAFREWQGGRWSFRSGDGEQRCLIMSVDEILAIVVEE